MRYIHIDPIVTLTHWGRVTHICVSKLSIIGSDNGLPPDRHQAVIRTTDGILLIQTLGTNFCEILREIHTFSVKNAFENVVCEMAAISFRPWWVKNPVHSGQNSRYGPHVEFLITNYRTFSRGMIRIDDPNNYAYLECLGGSRFDRENDMPILCSLSVHHVVGTAIGNVHYVQQSTQRESTSGSLGVHLVVRTVTGNVHYVLQSTQRGPWKVRNNWTTESAQGLHGDAAVGLVPQVSVTHAAGVCESRWVYVRVQQSWYSDRESLCIFTNLTRPLHSRPKRIPRPYPSLKITPFSRILNDKKHPFFNRNRWFWGPIKDPF